MAALALAGLAAAPALAEAPWRLLGRPGECAPLSSLGRREATLASVASPQDLADRMRRQGRAVRVAPVPGTGGGAVEVHVPELRLALVFVRADRCPT